jgi:hypothetical protein
VGCWRKAVAVVVEQAAVQVGKDKSHACRCPFLVRLCTMLDNNCGLWRFIFVPLADNRLFKGI